MLDAFSSMTIYTKYVKLPHSDDPIPTRIRDDPTIYPYFKDTVGAIDGMHIACTVTPKTVPITNPNAVREAHRNHLWEFRLGVVESKIVPTNGYKQS